ncbi:hypothetical protein KEM48_002502 [Puccinia striiformis f. sp. tritici PST-130]|nr:hypothetical protein KEM48_002502 [Puccinia striiformis f. sp. tritici PST-130]
MLSSINRCKVLASVSTSLKANEKEGADKMVPIQKPLELNFCTKLVNIPGCCSLIPSNWLQDSVDFKREPNGAENRVVCQRQGPSLAAPEPAGGEEDGLARAFTGTLRARLVKNGANNRVVGRSNHGRVASTKTSQKTTELIRTPANDEVGNRQLRYQAKLVVKRFEYLANYDFLDSDSTPTDLSIVRLRPKEHLLTELHSTLLPLLQKQIDSIADALMEPDKVWDNITLVLKLQPELEQTLDQTIRAIDEIIPGKLPEPNPRNDQNSREFKCYRLRGLNQTIRRDMKDYGKFFFWVANKPLNHFSPHFSPHQTTCKSTYKAHGLISIGVSNKPSAGQKRLN